MDHGRRQGGRPAAMWERAPVQIAYRASREYFTQLIEARPDVADEIVPACPEWTVRDLLAHVLEGTRFRYRPADRQALRPADELSVAQLLDEWARMGPQVEESIAGKAGFNYDVLVMDLFTHELDLRRVVDVPPPDDHPAFPTALGVVLGGFSASIHGHGLPALRIETEGAQWVAGWGTAAATVRAHHLDLYRSIAGRRTHRQIAQLSWSVPADKWLPAFTWGPFSPPEQATEDVIGIDAAYL